MNINEGDSLIITEQNINVLNLGYVEGKVQLYRVVCSEGREEKMSEFPHFTQYKGKDTVSS